VIWISGGDVTTVSGDDGLTAATDVVVTGGTIALSAGSSGSSSDAALKGIVAGVAVALGGDLTIDANDGVHSDGSVGIGGATLTVRSGDDGMHAEQSLEVRDGSILVADSYKGLEATSIAISGGTVDVTAQGDGINGAPALPPLRKELKAGRWGRGRHRRVRRDLGRLSPGRLIRRWHRLERDHHVLGRRDGGGGVQRPAGRAHSIRTVRSSSTGARSRSRAACSTPRPVRSCGSRRL
jgi:Carbohydrate-binding domain-containing protein Cthe_2159